MKANTTRCLAQKVKQPLTTGLMALVIAMSNVGVQTSQAALINTSQVGSGFTVTPADLAYILKQIKIAEYHVANTTSTTGLCGALLGSGPNQIPSPLLSFGLRTVDGSCNNLQSGQDKFGAADQTFPRLTVPTFDKEVELAVVPGIGPVGPPGPTNYKQTSGAVVDSQPRLASNLIVDQTSTNPAAVEVAGNPFRTQGNKGVKPCDTVPGSNPPVDIQPLQPAECVPQHETMFIPNVTTDVGLSPPFNSLFTIFGQFFDHGLDKITNGGNGTVFVPLKDDDPLVAGPDHILLDDPLTVCLAPNDPVGCDESADNLAPNLRFMALSRGKIVTGADGLRNALNTDTPFIDQSQTYTSHASHQVFMREYTSSTTGPGPFSTGKFLSEPDGGIATWARIKANAAQKLGMQLVDADVTNIPEIETDLYGNFIPGPLRGLPQYVTASGLVEGDTSSPVPVPANAVRINTAFLNDIAHSADPGSLTSPKTADANDTAGGSLDPVASGEYDNELLDLHFICGDGRCNENIGLTAIHQIFHMEHDRLVDDITNTLNLNPSLKAAYEAIKLTPNTLLDPGDKTFRLGERLFQAARFVTEMQYQHLVFEEFARKVQPAINPFEAFAFGQTDLNPAITAEFAHAVYRFGHSMLTETLPRPQLQEADGSPIPGTPLNNDIGLLEGFLNPAAFFDGGNGVKLTSSQATATLVMGLSDQVGNEIDEFVTETLRNHLLGLPLDLPSINMARARSEGIPSLNNVRKQIFAATNDGQLTPYANWVDFDQAIKNHSSLVNFIAAYGKHPTILAATTLVDKRAAAKNIVDGVTSDSDEFLFSTGAWANANGVSQTGVDDIDLWVGGLAENTNVFGGLLGPTFNYVFEKQLTDLQNGDRFYYLARTPGMNLRSQLEGNSFSELILRNTNPYTHTLKADPFATADCKFELGRLTWPAVNTNPKNVLFGAGTVNDDPLTECNENRLLIRSPTGRIQYRSTNSVDPLGINGQAVYNGTNFADDFFGGNDNDTFWGGLGDDRVEGGGGDDVVLGGEGDDIITDLSGFDFIKGGPGNDAIDAGIGDDIIIAGAGKDFTNGGANFNETFLGEGDDFAIAGQGTDAVFGDSGDDWMEGGDQPDLLIGDSSTLFFDDHNLPGHDILIGQGGDDDYDMEGGDDIGVGGPGVEKVAGASGFDWSIGLGDPQPQNADLALLIVNAPPANEVRDRYNEIEALSGWKFNDTLRGDNVVPSSVGGLGFVGCDALDQAGLDRIAGLDALVPPLTVDSAPIVANSATHYCLLQGNVWGEGNILLGGAGSDTLEGRGADDILDGDKYLNVRLSIRAGTDDPSGVDTVTNGSGAEIGSTGLMETVAVSGNFGPGTTGMTLQQAVFARKVNPGNIVAVREILTPDVVPAADCGLGASALNCDTAVFSGPATEYTITDNGDGSLKVLDNSGIVAGVPAAPRNNDGTDTLWNIEQLSFCPVPGAVKGTCNTDTDLEPGGAPRVIVSVAPVPVASSLTFGNRLVGSSLPNQNITVSNAGIANFNVTGVALSGANSDQFTVANNGCTVVTRDIPCAISVSFSPTSNGLKSAFVEITHNAAGVPSPLSVPVSGTGTSPIAVVVPDTFNFGNRNVGSTTTTPINLTNSGNVTLAISSIQVTGTDFSRVPGGCGTTLAAGVTCSIQVRFQPTGAVLRTGLLRITQNSNNVPGSVQDVALSGTGVVQLPVASVSPATLDFGNLQVNSTFQQAVTVTNTGTGTTPLAIGTGVTGTGFSRVNVAGGINPNCGTTLAAGLSCDITVRFRPTTGGVKNGNLRITSNSNNLPGTIQDVPLTGTATITANNDARTITANTFVTQVVNGFVRSNDVPNAGTVTINSSTKPSGATATVAFVPATNSVVWTLTGTGATNAAREASKRGVYTVEYTLTNGTATATATYTLTVI
jgi:Animal haem peroxidase/Abnormal spindle-like microcephaly-assoc'd, ASPM-SPD-2-Hydin/RTX calcium-binding nonapeptide repeat (4 copies)